MTSLLSMMTESDMTSPTSTTSSTSELVAGSKKMDDKISYRKSNKPMMEKKRRARINSCLTQLKSLVLQAMKKDNSQYSKLEKADILELTVKHLKNVQRLHNGLAATHVPDAVNKYRAGFNECANEVMRYLGESQEVNNDARSRIISHLANILTPINSLPLQQQQQQHQQQQQQSHTPILPAPSIVPSSSSSSSTLTSSSSLSSHIHLQQQQAQIVQHALSVQHQEQQQQQQQLLQQQQHSVLTHGNEALALGAERIFANSQTCHLPGGTRNATQAELNHNHIISATPTAFQSPVMNPVATSSSSAVQVPCIATNPAAMATSTPLQFVPSTLPTGQVAFVLTPQSIPAMNVYTPSVIAPSTITPEFAMSVLEQQKKQQQLQQQQLQQQQQHHAKQQEHRQLSISASRSLESNDCPISLVTRPNKLTGSNCPPSSSLVPPERSGLSASPPASSSSSSTSTSTISSPPSSTSSSFSSSKLSHSCTTVQTPASSTFRTSTTTLDDDASPSVMSKISNRSRGHKDDIENIRKGEYSVDTARRESLGELSSRRKRMPSPNIARRGISDHFHRHENIENARRVPTPMDYDDDNDAVNDTDSFIKPGEGVVTIAGGRNVEGMARSIMMSEDAAIKLSMRVKVECDNNDNEVLDCRTTKCGGSDARVQANQSTWRPW